MDGDIADLQAFVAVAVAGGFAAAAKRLHSTPVMINRRVSRLEDRVGTRLLTRSTRGAVPTDAGWQFHERCVTILADLDGACQELRGGAGEPEGFLRITAPASLDRLLVQPVVSALMQRHSGLRFDLLLSDRRIDLSAQQVDLAVRGGPLADSTLKARLLATVPVIMAAGQGYLARKGSPRTAQDLSTHALLEHAEVGLATWWSPQAKAQPPAPRQRLRVNSFEMLVDLAEADAGLCVAPQVHLAQALAAGRLERVLPDLPLTDVPLWAVYSTARVAPLRLRVLVDSLLAQAARPFTEWGLAPEAGR